MINLFKSTMGELIRLAGDRGKEEDPEFLRRVREILKEIERHKWLESEKAGYDIGGNKAARDWIEHHYEDWSRHKGYFS